MSGNDSDEVTPVPIPNTAVKLFSADGSWGFAPARVGRRQAAFLFILLFRNEYGEIHIHLVIFHSSSVVEQSAVNRSVVGSNPTCGAIYLLP